MKYRIVSVTEVDDTPALEDLLTEYYTVILRKLVKAGGPANKKPGDLVSSVMGNIQAVLPAIGRLFLAYGEGKGFVGCGTFQQVRPDAGELKRLYVRLEASGNRLGRALVDARMKAA